MDSSFRELLIVLGIPATGLVLGWVFGLIG